MPQTSAAKLMPEIFSPSEHVDELHVFVSRPAVDRHYASVRIVEIALHYANLEKPLPACPERGALVEALNDAAEHYQLLEHEAVINARKGILLGPIGW